MICYYGGKYYKDSSEIKIPITDLALTRGWAIFDFMRTYGLKPVLLKLHLVRFRNSLKEAGIRLTFDEKSIERIISKLMQLNKIRRDVAFRIIVTAGDSKDSFNPSKKPRLIILTEQIHSITSKFRAKGYFAQIVGVQRLLPSAKTVNYLPGLKLLADAKKQGFDDVIYISGNNVLEGVTNNIFIVKNNKLITPKEKVLGGITRQLILKVAINNNIPTYERNISVQQLLDSDEVFSTSTIRQILPITKINGKIIGDGKSGKLTNRLDILFKDHISSLLKDY